MTVLLRTAPVSNASLVNALFSVREHNAVVRLFSTATQLGMLDFAAWVQSLPDSDVFVDGYRVQPKYLIAYAVRSIMMSQVGMLLLCLNHVCAIRCLFQEVLRALSLFIVRGLRDLADDFASLGINASAVVYGPLWEPAASVSCMDETFVATQAINAGFFEGVGEPSAPRPWRSWRTFAFPAFDSFWNSSVAGNPTPPGVPFPPNASKVHILLFGDSVDRGNLEQACKFWNKKNGWAHDALWLQPDPAGGGKIPGRDEFLVCETPWGSAEAIHTFGAQQRESCDMCAPRRGSVPHSPRRFQVAATLTATTAPAPKMAR